MLPRLMVHCDWGAAPEKRWHAKALLQGDSLYRISKPELVGDLDSFLARVHEQAGKNGCTLVGFDFPIGLPPDYAKKARIRSFKDFLLLAGRGEWSGFYKVAETPAEISLHRSFYPFRPGGSKQRYLLEALGAGSMDGLRRRCELKQAQRKAACPIFWTLGAQQVGKGAIVGWRDVIVPAIRHGGFVSLWPFDGPFRKLLRPGRTVVAETYPAEYYRRLCPSLLKGGKRNQGNRGKAVKELVRWAENCHIRMAPGWRTPLAAAAGEGEDPFDAIVGLLAMLEVVRGQRESGEPEEARESEGWILGQSPGDAR
jgi:hypothetical protein